MIPIVMRLTIILCISLMAISLMLTDISHARIDPKSIVGMWTFDEAKGDKALDSSGNGNDGQLTNDPKWVDGKFGKALEFDGKDDYVEVAGIDTPSIITFSCWFKKLGSGNGGVPRLHSRGTSPWSLEFGIGNSAIPNQLGFYLAFADGSNTGWNGVFEPENDVWYHTAVSYDGTSVNLYVDGKEVASRKDWSKKEVNQGISRIGGHAAGGDCFEGIIDEVAIYNVALSLEDIKSSMTPSAVSPAGKISTTWASIKKH